MPTVDDVRPRSDGSSARSADRRVTSAAGMAARAASAAAMAKAGRNERVDRVGDGVHQVVARSGHRVVVLGATLVELAGKVRHLTTRRLVDGFPQRPGHRELVGEREIGEQHRLGGAERGPLDAGDQARATTPAR